MSGGGEWDLGHHAVHLHDAHAHVYDEIEAGLGDESRTWKFYGWQHGDRFFRSVPSKAARVTPMVSLALDDAKYLQAMVGGLGFLLPVAGCVCGLMSTLKFGGYVVPPELPLYLTITVLSIFSAFAGMMALLPIALGAVVTGNLTSISSAMTLFVLGCIWIAGPQLARRFRPLNDHRAMENEPFDKWWTVTGDYVIQIVMTMFILGKLTIVLPIVSKLNVPVAEHEQTVWLVAGATVLFRQALETIARHHYPRRIFLVTSDFRTVQRGKVLNTFFVVIVQMTVVYAALSLVLGVTWQTWVVGSVYGLMLIVAAIRKKFPEKKWIYRLTPIGIARIVLFILMGEFAAHYFEHHGVTEPVELTGSIFLIISIFLLVLTFFGKFPGEPWPKNALWKALGVATVAMLIGLATGSLSLL
jgi:hypothetical protein